jgi:hypothetical protein
MDTMAQNIKESRAARAVRGVFESGRPLTYIQSAEEQRVVRVLREVSERIGAPVWTWSSTEGNGADGPRAALDYIIARFFISKIFMRRCASRRRCGVGCGMFMSTRLSAGNL